jgi:hypothetical protein
MEGKTPTEESINATKFRETCKLCQNLIEIDLDSTLYSYFQSLFICSLALISIDTMESNPLQTLPPGKKVVSRATKTILQPDESRIVVTTSVYDDGTKEETQEKLPPRGEELPTPEAPAGPEDREVGGYLTFGQVYNTTSPLSEVILDDNEEDISVMESLFEHPILLDVESQSPFQEVTMKSSRDSVPDPAVEAVLKSLGSRTEGMSPNTSGVNDFTPSIEKYTADRRCENKWLILAILILGIGGVGTAVGVMVGLQSYRDKVSSTAINEQAGASAGLSQSQTPTSKPSESPTSSPSMRPSVPDDTLSPSQVISEVPSPLPTISPSDFPTLNPTMLPTSQPTYNPTDFPSSFPTNSPITPYPSFTPAASSSAAPVATTLEPVTDTTGAPVLAVSNSPIFQNRPVASPVAPDCKDSIGWVDKDNQGCSTYETNGCSMAFLQANSVGVGAKRACCTCGGGNRDYVTTSNIDSCRDYFGFVDNSNDSCDWYLQNDRCGFAALYANVVGVSAQEACCGCGGGYQI